MPGSCVWLLEGAQYNTAESPGFRFEMLLALQNFGSSKENSDRKKEQPLSQNAQACAGDRYYQCPAETWLLNTEGTVCVGDLKMCTYSQEHKFTNHESSDLYWCNIVFFFLNVPICCFIFLFRCSTLLFFHTLFLLSHSPLKLWFQRLALVTPTIVFWKIKSNWIEPKSNLPLPMTEQQPMYMY